MTKKTIIQPKGMAEAVGPFSRAILIGDQLHIAGTTALSHVTGDYYTRDIPKTIEEQTRLTLDNIRMCVEAAGGTMDDIFKVVIMLKNPEDYKRMNAVRGEYFKKEPPISTCFRAEVMRSDLLVEIEAVALIQNPKHAN
jgi:2-iminobutanoate/2-iminopropanoate deaminase